MSVAPVFPPPPHAMPKRRRVGIAVRISVGLTVMGLVVVGMGAVSLTAFRQFDGEVTHLSSATVPHVVAGANLLSEMQKLIAQLPALAVAGNSPQRRAAMEAASRQIDFLSGQTRDIRGLAGSGASPQTVQVLDQIDSTLAILAQTVADLDAEMGRHAAAADRQAQAIGALNRLTDGMDRLVTGTAGDQAGAGPAGDAALRALGPWAVRVGALVTRTAAAIQLDHLNRLRSEQRQVADALHRLPVSGPGLPAPVHAAMDRLERDLESVLLGDDGVFAAAAARLQARYRAQGLLSQSRVLVETLDRAAHSLFDDIQAQARERTLSLGMMIDRESRLVLMLAALSVMVAAAVYFLFRASLSTRLLALNHAVLGRLSALRATRGAVVDAGVAIPVGGNDEITDIAASIRFFIDEIGRRQQALAEEERRFRDLVEGSIQGIVIHRNFSPLYANDAYAAVVGVGVADVLAMPSLLTLIPPENQADALATYRRLIATGEVMPRRRLRNLRPGGGDYWVELWDRRIDWMGEPAAQSVVVDVTREMEAEAALARASEELSTAVAAMPSGLLMLDADWTVRLANERLGEVTGYSASLLTPGTPFVAMLREEEAAGRLPPGQTADSIFQRVTGVLSAGQPLMVERALPDGRAMLIQGQSADHGGAVLTFTDITEQERIRGELQRSRDAAERALSDLKDAQRSLIQAEKMASLGQLVAGVAHEVNTPIGITVTGASQLQIEVEDIRGLHAARTMKRSDFERFLGMAGDLSDLILANSQRAADLIQSFKMVAIDQSSEERRRFPLKSYIEEALRSLGPGLRTAACRVTVDCGEDLEIDGYPGAVSQILTNLVMNALLHAFDAGPGGSIAITVRCPTGGRVVLTFADDGRGIPADVLPKIFDPFFTTRRGSGGSGLGLHIVYNLVTATLRGTIQAHSEPGKGTRFTLTFPRVMPVQGEGSLPAQHGAAAAGGADVG
ncbi:PAS domain S-box-containing protein [Azospirillum fermentarium]|uniref:ATP-binding protein n=1 Tax=Azospirillum fermentarium TaxID=1233114 RepID=UPI0022262F66|nr:ATP-binding protein [Azospirillum fermentarium]MCW2247325.1 PAS domain S-box-containing protein [Azospirillum fermentarium]